MKRLFFLAALSAMCLASCRQVDIEVEQTTGTLALSVSNKTDYVTIVSKAGSDTENGAIDYTNTADYDVVIDGPTRLDMKYSQFSGQVTELGSGNYTVTVTSPKTHPAAFDQPIYQAFEEFVIKAGEVTPLDLVCTPANCKVTIRLSPNFVKELATYEVAVNNGLADPLVWTKNTQTNDFAAGSVDEDGYLVSTKAGYFLPRGLEIFVKGHRSTDDTEATAQLFIENPQPAEHHIINLDADVTGQIGGITIKVIDTFNPVNEDIKIDGFEDQYVDRPDFGDGDDEEEVQAKNEIIWEENKTFEDYAISSDSQISMTISMPKGIASFVVKVDHADFQNALTMFTGDLDGDGKNETDIDLIKDTAFATNILNVNGGDTLPTGDRVKDQTELVFDLTCFVPLLCNTAPGQTIPFILEAYDVEGTPLLVLGDFPRITLITPAGN